MMHCQNIPFQFVIRRFACLPIPVCHWIYIFG